MRKIEHLMPSRGCEWRRLLSSLCLCVAYVCVCVGAEHVCEADSCFTLQICFPSLFSVNAHTLLRHCTYILPASLHRTLLHWTHTRTRTNTTLYCVSCEKLPWKINKKHGRFLLVSLENVDDDILKSRVENYRSSGVPQWSRWMICRANICDNIRRLLGEKLQKQWRRHPKPQREEVFRKAAARWLSSPADAEGFLTEQTTQQLTLKLSHLQTSHVEILIHQKKHHIRARLTVFKKAQNILKRFSSRLPELSLLWNQHVNHHTLQETRKTTKSSENASGERKCKWAADSELESL